MEDTFVRVRVAGLYACFSRPEMKVERVSYEVMTPSAARGVLDAVLWRPEMRWVVRNITVLRPIRFISIRRNEVQSKIAPRTVHGWMKDPRKYEPLAAGAGEGTDGTPRNTLALKDVAYVIEAEPRVFSPNGDNTPTKYMAMFNRRVEKGQCFQQPYLGCREFACSFSPPDPSENPIAESLELGLMLYDVAKLYDVANPEKGQYKPYFFRARLENGILDTRPEVVLRDAAQREEVLACSYRP
ncbi:MAG: type I-C CRISPR-associated protein Cas5c [Pseudomonadota bacterium]